MTLPLLALDVDGVLCPVVAPGHRPDTWPEWEASDYNIMATGVIERLTTLPDRVQARVGWLTTWGPRARNDLAPRFNLPDWPVLSTEDEFLSPGWWKLVTMARLLDEGNRVVWVDDDLAYSKKLGELEPLLATGMLSYVSPDCYLGVTEADLVLIESLLAPT